MVVLRHAGQTLERGFPSTWTFTTSQSAGQEALEFEAHLM